MAIIHSSDSVGVSWNNTLLQLIVAAGSQAGAMAEGHQDLYVAHSDPIVTRDTAKFELEASWPTEGSLSFNIPGSLLEVGEEQERTVLVGRLREIAHASALLANADPLVAIETVENYCLHLEELIVLKDSLAEDGLIITVSSSDEKAIVYAVEEAANLEGRKANFAEVLLALNQARHKA